MLDLSAAYNTVSHKLLLSSLNQLGVHASALEWFETYLADRDQVIYVHDAVSSPQPLGCGVPQGPILFNIYTAPMGHLLRQQAVGYHFYADDTGLHHSEPKPGGNHCDPDGRVHLIGECLEVWAPYEDE